MKRCVNIAVLYAVNDLENSLLDFACSAKTLTRVRGECVLLFIYSPMNFILLITYVSKIYHYDPR